MQEAVGGLLWSNPGRNTAGGDREEERARLWCESPYKAASEEMSREELMSGQKPWVMATLPWEKEGKFKAQILNSSKRAADLFSDKRALGQIKCSVKLNMLQR